MDSTTGIIESSVNSTEKETANPYFLVASVVLAVAVLPFVIAVGVFVVASFKINTLGKAPWTGKMKLSVGILMCRNSGAILASSRTSRSRLGE